MIKGKGWTIYCNELWMIVDRKRKKYDLDYDLLKGVKNIETTMRIDWCKRNSFELLVRMKPKLRRKSNGNTRI